MISKQLKEFIELQLTEKFSQIGEIENIKAISGGCINETFKLETNQSSFFLKINSSRLYPGMFATEAKGLNLLSEANEITIPAVILADEHETNSFLILEWIERGKRTKNFFENFGTKLARLHKHSNECFGLDHDNYIGSLPQYNKPDKNGVEFFIQQRLVKQIEIAKEHNNIEDSTINQFDKLFKKLPQLIPNEKPSLLHGDLWNGNYMTDKSGTACLIDPAVYYGYREVDLAMTKLFGGFDSEFYGSYNNEYPLQQGWQQRLDIFNLYPLMVHVNLFGQGYLGQVKQILSAFI